VSAAAEKPAPDQRPSTGQDSTTPDPLTGCGVSHAMRGAAGVALEALEERVRASRLLLTDRTLYGLADRQIVQRSLARDEQAAQMLRAAPGLWSAPPLGRTGDPGQATGPIREEGLMTRSGTAGGQAHWHCKRGPTAPVG